jgi:hypothetical protein
MGAALYIALEQPIPGFDPFVDGKALSKASGQLDSIATELGVRPLMEFFSADPEMAAEFLPEGVEAPPQVWFTAADGLATVSALQAHLGVNPYAVPRLDQVLTDLANMEQILTTASEHGVKWCLQIDF